MTVRQIAITEIQNGFLVHDADGDSCEYVPDSSKALERAAWVLAVWSKTHSGPPEPDDFPVIPHVPTSTESILLQALKKVHELNQQYWANERHDSVTVVSEMGVLARDALAKVPNRKDGEHD